MAVLLGAATPSGAGDPAPPLSPRARSASPALPRTVDGKPDLTGLWEPRLPTPLIAPATDRNEALARERRRKGLADHPTQRCLPGEPWQPAGPTGGPIQFVQSRDVLVLLFGNAPGYRQVFLDGRTMPEYVPPSWLGYSTARWRDDTLVVTTANFNDEGWLGDYSHSNRLSLEERFTRDAIDRIKVSVIVTDAEAFRRSWHFDYELHLIVGRRLEERVCEKP